MKAFLRVVGIAVVVGIVIAVVRAVQQYREDSVFDLAPASNAQTNGMGKRSISPELLSILADPADKGPVELLSDDGGKEWLVNRRNGFRYPVEDGIPIMLIEEGEKNKDENLISK